MPLLKRVEAGSALIYKGDPRLEETDMDKWLRIQLGSTPPSIAARPYLYGSDAGFCARRNVLLEHNIWLDSNINAAGYAYMAIGTALENLLAEALTRGGHLLAQNYRLLPMKEIKISGKIDFIIFDSAGELALVECKSCGDLPTEPKPTHLAQIQTYAACSGVTRCWLTYVSRNLKPHEPIQTRTFEVDTSEEALTERLRIAFLSRLASDERAVPPLPFTFRKHTECHYCEFRDHFCWGSRPGLGSEPPLLPGELEELSPARHMELAFEARRRSEALYIEGTKRRGEFIQALILDEGIGVEFKKRLVEITKRI